MRNTIPNCIGQVGAFGYFSGGDVARDSGGLVGGQGLAHCWRVGKFAACHNSPLVEPDCRNSPRIGKVSLPRTQNLRRMGQIVIKIAMVIGFHVLPPRFVLYVGLACPRWPWVPQSLPFWKTTTHNEKHKLFARMSA